MGILLAVYFALFLYRTQYYQKCNLKEVKLNKCCKYSPFTSTSFAYSIDNQLFTCTLGVTISVTQLCDGEADCSNGNDESTTLCESELI